MRKVCRMHRTYIFSSRFDWNASRWMIRKGRHTRPTRSALAYNGEFFPITNAPCLRCIVENASPFSIVFSQLETEWLTIPISFVSFFSFPPSSFRFLCLLFFFLYYTRGRFYFIFFFFFFFFFFFYGIGDDIQGYCSNLWIVQESETRMRGSMIQSEITILVSILIDAD